MKYEIEVTQETPNGLDYLIKDGNGEAVAWAYEQADAEKIVDALNSLTT